MSTAPPVAAPLAQLISRIADRRPGRSEADLQADIAALLHFGGLNLDDDEIVRREAPTADGTRRRIDIERGRTVFELKNDLRIGNARVDALEQLAGYVQTRTQQLGQRYVGVLTDGVEWMLCALRPDGTLVVVSDYRLDVRRPDRLTAWLESVLATQDLVIPTPHQIESRLGAKAPGSQLDLSGLRAVYDAHRNDSHVQMKRELWGRLLTIALGTSFDESDELFIEHTYLVIVAELIAHAVVGLDITNPDLTGSDLLSGEEFRRAEIAGVVEKDFFDWPADTPDGDRLVRDIARRLSRFDWSEVEHDVLKVLYESVIDPETRKRLGEYYTPDWLAQKIVDETVTDPLSQRVLDPACGSGTFLFWAVRRFLAAADEQGLSNREAVGRLVGHVFGVDLHPVAVTLARVTYLLAIGKDRLVDRDAFTVPIYLGDSVQWRDEGNTLLSERGLEVFTTDGAELFARRLYFPERLLEDPKRFDRLIAELSDKASKRDRGARPLPPTKAILNRHKVHADDRESVEMTFKQLCALHDDGRNHIWGYYIRNIARPLWFTRDKVQVLVGNPPWLSYRYMKGNLQDDFRALATERGLWAGAAVATHQDLSALFVIRGCELYLRNGGSFSFVMPAATLSRQQYKGFRTGSYASATEHTAVAFARPWDLTAVKPSIFPVPAAVVHGQRAAAAVALPALPHKWSGRLPDHRRAWAAASEHLKGYDEGPDVVVRSEHGVDVADGPGSPYAPDFRQGATILPRVLVIVEPAPAGPLGVPSGLRALQSSRTSQEKEPWKGLPSIRGTVESRFVFPMHGGHTILPYRPLHPVDAVLPLVDGQVLEDDDPRLEEFPRFADWWRQSTRLWAENKSERSRLSLRQQLDFQGKLRGQFPMPDHRVVYSASGSQLAAARVTGDAVIEHKLYWAPVASVDEGRYLTAILNSQVLGERVRPLQSVGQFGPRDFDKYVFRIPFPRYDRGDDLHQRIAAAAGRAEREAAGVEIPSGMGFQRARALIRAALDASGAGAEIEACVRELLAPPSPVVSMAPLLPEPETPDLLTTALAKDETAERTRAKQRTTPTPSRTPSEPERT